MELNWNHMAEYLREVCAKGRVEGEGSRSSADSHTHTAGWLWPWHWHRRGAGGRLAHSLLGCPVSTVTRQP